MDDREPTRAGMDADLLRTCRDRDRTDMLRIINGAAEAYRGAIPADAWHDPYMSAEELDAEIARGVAFSGYEAAGRLVGVMGIQGRGDFRLIRHAYVAPDRQGRGVGSALLARLCGGGPEPVLVGTWRAATWAIRFYQRNGFALVPEAAAAPLLRRYWSVPERQIEASVVLAWTPNAAGAARLVAGIRA